MEFYRQVDPQGIGEYYRRLTSELDACINQLSDVILSGKSDWICQLQEITHRLRHTLSMDANGITGDIRAHLDALEKLTSDNPEAP
jgi:hypothetical protein